MKILILQDDFPPYEHGGAGVIAGLAARGFAAAGHEVFVITTVQKRELEGIFSENGMKIFRIFSDYHVRWRSYRSLHNRAITPQIKKIIDEIKPDAVHAHNIHYHISYYALKLARKHTDKVFLTTHDIMSFYQGTFTEFINKKDLSCPKAFDYRVNQLMLFRAFKKRHNPFHNFFVRGYLKNVKKIVTVSNALQDALSQNNIRNTTVIYNGIDVENWNVARQDPEGKEFILFGGRLSGAKGGDLMLQALAIVAAKRSQARLLIFGKKDAYSDRILARAKELGVEDRIVMVGWQGEEALKKHYNLSSLAVVPSVCFDSFPTVNLQAFASNKPVIATCFGGSRELVHDGENGFIVNPYNVKTLAEKILYLLENPEKAKEFGENGYRLVAEKHNLKAMVEKYLSLFSE